MAHQTHSLPWQTITSHFAYTRKSHIDPNFHDIYTQDKPNQAKDLNYFSKAFVSCIEEAARTERKKCASKAKFRERASSWRVSSAEGEEEKISDGKWRSPVHEAIAKASKPEDRKVYRDSLGSRYPYSKDSHEWGGLDPMTQHIEDWLAKRNHEACLNTIKILIIESAFATHPISRREENLVFQKECLETLLLLANHPDIPHEGYWYIPSLRSRDECIESLPEKALRAYLFFNILFCLHEQNPNVDCALAEGEPRLPNQGSAYAGHWLPEKTVARMDKKYMNTLAWAKMAGYLTNGQDADVEMHRPYLCPRWGTGEGEEVKDVLADGEELRKYLKGLWRVLVLYEMLEKEMQQRVVDWEEMIVDGMTWIIRNLKSEYDDSLKRKAFC